MSDSKKRINAWEKRKLFWIFILLLLALTMGKGEIQARWLDLHFYNIPEMGLSVEEVDHIKATLGEVLDVFRMAPPLNPPQGFDILPRVLISSREIFPDGGRGVVLSRITMSMWFPQYQPRLPATARVSVWMNDPESFLGDPLLADPMGSIYLLPPVVGQSRGGDMFSRGAHPPGYEEAYPSYSMFPLWGFDVEPFLRSVVRPSFGLGINEGVATVLTRDGNPFWVPVSQERWIRALQDYARMEIKDVQLGFEALEETELTEFQIKQTRDYMARLQKAFSEEEIIRNHEEMLSDSIKMYEYYKTINVEVAQDFYETMIEDADRRLEENLEIAVDLRQEFAQLEEQILYALMSRQEVMSEMNALIGTKDWDGLEELGKELDLSQLIFLAYAGRAIDGLEAELAGLSPAERSAPAYGFELPPWHPFGPHRQVVAMPFDAARISGLVSPDSEGARALVAIDPSFFNPLLPPTDIQLMVVGWWEETHPRYYSPTGSAYNEIRVQLLERLWNSLDWRSLSLFLK